MPETNEAIHVAVTQFVIVLFTSWYREWAMQLKLGGELGGESGFGNIIRVERCRKLLKKLAPPSGFEPETFPLGGGRSIQLS